MAPKKRSTDEANAPTAPPRRSTRLATTTTTTNTATKPEQSKKKKPKKSKPKKSPKEEQPAAAAAAALAQKEEAQQDVVVDAAAKTIIIEHCKQCNSFKTRAVQVKDGLEKSVEGVNVVVNPEKPRRGCFEIREENGEVFISLLDMKRPFKPMKELDMDQVIADIVDKIK